MKFLGYAILRKIKYEVVNSNGITELLESDFKLDYKRKKVYKNYQSAEEAVKHFKDKNINDEFKIIRLYYNEI